MQSVKQKDTKPELIMRSALHRLGYRFRLHVSGLSGRPDVVFPSRKKVVFVHGCFWHGHECDKGKPPRSRQEYWLPKLAANKKRDERNVNELEGAGWQCLTIWQCETKEMTRTMKRVVQFLGPASKRTSAVAVQSR